MNSNDFALSFISLPRGLAVLVATLLAVLSANIAATVNVVLQVGHTSEQVVVNAGGAELLNTETPTNSTTISQLLLQSLPNNTLQPLNFVYALAGTTQSQAGGWTNRSSSQ